MSYLRSIYYTEKRWDFTLDEKPHYVLLTVDTGPNTRVIEFNDHIVVKDKVYHNGGGQYEFADGAHRFRVEIESAYFSLRRLRPLGDRCYLYVDGVKIED